MSIVTKEMIEAARDAWAAYWGSCNDANVAGSYDCAYEAIIEAVAPMLASVTQTRIEDMPTIPVGAKQSNSKGAPMLAKPAAQGEAVAMVIGGTPGITQRGGHLVQEIKVLRTLIEPGTKLYTHPIAVAGILRDQPED